MPWSWYLKKSSKLIGVHWLGLKLFGIIVWKLLIIETFFQWKLNKIKTENFIGVLGRSWRYWKALNKSNLIKFISEFLELRCGRYWFFNGFKRKHQSSLQCVHNVKFQNFQFRKCEKQRILGPTKLGYTIYEPFILKIKAMEIYYGPSY